GYGPSHQATEDLAIFRGMPNLTIIDPCDATEIAQAVPAIADHPGPVYMRLLRGKVPDVLSRYGYAFEIGKAQEIRGGKDVLFISTGFMTMRVLDAAERLAADGVDCAVLHVPTIKPLDIQTLAAEASKGGRLVVTAENHSISGGLGEAVAACLMRDGVHVPFRQIALPDAFLDAGALPTLHDQYGLSVDAVTAAVKSWL
ncbi:MAG: transketolase family protein, partial [Hyphomicrobiales bacterium]|nr:transketolase family protein [Hyphomicrobiales bacterium]